MIPRPARGDQEFCSGGFPPHRRRAFVHSGPHRFREMRRPTLRTLLAWLVLACAIAGCDRKPPEPGIEVETEPPWLSVLPITTGLNDGPPPVAANEPPPAASEDAAPAGRCDPNYTPCVPIDHDVDCEGGRGNGPSYVRGPVQVVGSDPYGLDRDGDGVGCEN